MLTEKYKTANKSLKEKITTFDPLTEEQRNSFFYDFSLIKLADPNEPKDKQAQKGTRGSEEEQASKDLKEKYENQFKFLHKKSQQFKEKESSSSS